MTPSPSRVLVLMLTRGPGRLLVPAFAIALAACALWLVPADAQVVRASADPSGALRVAGAQAPVFQVADLEPGESADATITVRNEGMLGRTVTLSIRDLVDDAGIGGGVLSQRVELLVEDASDPAAAPLFRGTLAQATQQGVPVGRLGAGEQRDLRLTLTFPEGGEPPSNTTGDNAFQAARSTFTIAFDGQDDPPPPPGPPDPPPPGGGSPAPGSPPGSASAGGLQTAGAGGVTPSPSPARPGAKRPTGSTSRTCGSRRSFPIRLRVPRSFRGRIRSIRVTVDGRRVPVKRLKRYVARVDLKGRPKSRYTVRIVITRVDGRRSVDVRRYRTCKRVVKKKPAKGAKKPKLVVETGIAPVG